MSGGDGSVLVIVEMLASDGCGSIKRGHDIIIRVATGWVCTGDGWCDEC